MLLGKHLRKVINQLEDENKRLKTNNSALEHDCMLLLDTNRDLRNKVVVLENNLEIVTNNLTPKKKKLLGLED